MSGSVSGHRLVFSSPRGPIGRGEAARVDVLDAADRRLRTGFHGYEPAEGIRWTQRDAELPFGPFAEFAAAPRLELQLGGAMRYPAGQ